MASKMALTMPAVGQARRRCTAGAHPGQRFLTRSPLPGPLPRRAPDRISRHFIMGLQLKFRPRSGVKMALTMPAGVGQAARRRRSPAISEPPARLPLPRRAPDRIN
jgi:hypothetical protein